MSSIIDRVQQNGCIPTPVEAYYNLHKHCLSYRPRGGRVLHAEMLVLRDARFAVQPAGQARVRAEGRKNVHAYVRGIATHVTSRGVTPPLVSDDVAAAGGRRITYNPYVHDTFVFADDLTPALRHPLVIVLNDRSVWALPEEVA